jgi:DNA-binding response OmpR family regulator
MKILIVDDEVIIAKALARAFVAKNHEVVLRHSGEEGLEAWEKESPDIVFLDVIMPSMTGPQVIQEYKKRNVKLNKNCFIVLMTAHSGVKHKESALEAGANEFIQKPFDNVFEIVEKIVMAKKL